MAVSRAHRRREWRGIPFEDWRRWYVGPHDTWVGSRVSQWGEGAFRSARRLPSRPRRDQCVSYQ
jgi:hypothetical protein